MDTILPLRISPGINRDNTPFSHPNCTDGRWCRFYYGKARKIGGYRQMYSLPFLPRGADVISQNGINYYFAGGQDALYMMPTDNTGAVSPFIDRTPATLVNSPNNVWQLDDMFDGTSSKRVIIAHPGQNLTAIDSTVQSDIYYGEGKASTILTPVLDGSSAAVAVSGGAFCMYPYLFALDNDGYARWTAAGTLTFGGGDSGSARITGAKLIAGKNIRGGSGYSPAGLIWSLDSLQRLYYNGGTNVFNNDTMGSTYLLSSSAVVEYNGLFYWPSADRRFCYYNGAINDLPNNFNQSFFFDNLNMAQRQKVWGIAVPAYNEIWWHFPFGNSTECNWIVIFNVKDNVWYDTPLAGRSCGVNSRVFPYPVMFDNTPDISSNYSMWQHEFGYDQTVGSDALAIESFFETPIVDLLDMQQPMDKWVYLDWLEPDFNQVGDMSFTVTGEQYPQDKNTVTYGPYTIPVNSPKVDVRKQLRLLRLRFDSNTQGGYYQMGKPLLKVKDGNGRQFNPTE